MNPYEDTPVITPLAEHLGNAECAPPPRNPVQTELSFDPGPVKRRRLQADAASLETLLREAWHGGMPWMSAAQIGARLGWNERRVRDAASESHAVASGPGSPGYALAEAATPDLLMHIGNAMKAQADRMFARGQRFVTAALLRMKAAEITQEVHHEGAKH